MTLFWLGGVLAWSVIVAKVSYRVGHDAGSAEGSAEGRDTERTRVRQALYPTD